MAGPAWIGRESEERGSENFAPGSSEGGAGSMHAQCSANRVSETGGIGGMSGIPEHVGPEQGRRAGAGFAGAVPCGSGNCNARGSMTPNRMAT